MGSRLGVRKWHNWVIVTLFIFSLIGYGGCGYRFPGGGEIPGGLTLVSIPLFTNLTNEIGLENTLTNDLTNEFIVRRKKSLSTDDEMADGSLEGKIVSVNTHTITQTVSGGSVEREVVVAVDVRLIDKDGQLLWLANNVSARENYDVGSNATTADANRQEALEALSVRLAEKIFNRLVEDF